MTEQPSTVGSHDKTRATYLAIGAVLGAAVALSVIALALYVAHRGPSSSKLTAEVEAGTRALQLTYQAMTIMTTSGSSVDLGTLSRFTTQVGLINADIEGWPGRLPGPTVYAYLELINAAEQGLPGVKPQTGGDRGLVLARVQVEEALRACAMYFARRPDQVLPAAALPASLTPTPTEVR